LFYAVDGFQPSDEYAERVHLSFLADLIQISVFAPPKSIPVELATGERVEILDFLLITPADEVTESVLVALQRGLR
jgi:putative ubiquitin-RnfH superfamily antitoxin RatB of RatAB toxin-antitoxin module